MEDAPERAFAGREAFFAAMTDRVFAGREAFFAAVPERVFAERCAFVDSPGFAFTDPRTPVFADRADLESVDLPEVSFVPRPDVVPADLAAVFFAARPEVVPADLVRVFAAFLAARVAAFFDDFSEGAPSATLESDFREDGLRSRVRS